MAEKEWGRLRGEKEMSRLSPPTYFIKGPTVASYTTGIKMYMCIYKSSVSPKCILVHMLKQRNTLRF